MDRRDGKHLAQLLRELAKLEGLQWIRLLYCYPSYFSDELIEEIAVNDKVRLVPARTPTTHTRRCASTLTSHCSTLAT